LVFEVGDAVVLPPGLRRGVLDARGGGGARRA
jgi:hypothetical protein